MNDDIKVDDARILIGSQGRMWIKIQTAPAVFS